MNPASDRRAAATVALASPPVAASSSASSGVPAAGSCRAGGGPSAPAFRLLVLDDDTTCLDFPLPYRYTCYGCTAFLENTARSGHRCLQPWCRRKKPPKRNYSYKDELEWLNDQRLPPREGRPPPPPRGPVSTAHHSSSRNDAVAPASLEEGGAPSRDPARNAELAFHLRTGLRPGEVVVAISAIANDLRLKKVAAFAPSACSAPDAAAAALTDTTEISSRSTDPLTFRTESSSSPGATETGSTCLIDPSSPRNYTEDASLGDDSCALLIGAKLEPTDEFYEENGTSAEGTRNLFQSLPLLVACQVSVPAPSRPSQVLSPPPPPLVSEKLTLPGPVPAHPEQVDAALPLTDAALDDNAFENHWNGPTTSYWSEAVPLTTRAEPSLSTSVLENALTCQVSHVRAPEVPPKATERPMTRTLPIKKRWALRPMTGLQERELARQDAPPAAARFAPASASNSFAPLSDADPSPVSCLPGLETAAASVQRGDGRQREVSTASWGGDKCARDGATSNRSSHSRETGDRSASRKGPASQVAPGASPHACDRGVSVIGTSGFCLHEGVSPTPTTTPSLPTEASFVESSLLFAEGMPSNLDALSTAATTGETTVQSTLSTGPGSIPTMLGDGLTLRGDAKSSSASLTDAGRRRAVVPASAAPPSANASHVAQLGQLETPRQTVYGLGPVNGAATTSIPMPTMRGFESPHRSQDSVPVLAAHGSNPLDYASCFPHAATYATFRPAWDQFSDPYVPRDWSPPPTSRRGRLHSTVSATSSDPWARSRFPQGAPPHPQQTTRCLHPSHTATGFAVSTQGREAQHRPYQVPYGYFLRFQFRHQGSFPWSLGLSSSQHGQFPAVSYSGSKCPMIADHVGELRTQGELPQSCAAPSSYRPMVGGAPMESHWPVPAVVRDERNEPSCPKSLSRARSSESESDLPGEVYRPDRAIPKREIANPTILQQSSDRSTTQTTFPKPNFTPLRRLCTEREGLPNASREVENVPPPGALLDLIASGAKSQYNIAPSSATVPGVVAPRKPSPPGTVVRRSSIVLSRISTGSREEKESFPLSGNKRKLSSLGSGEVERVTNSSMNISLSATESAATSGGLGDGDLAGARSHKTWGDYFIGMLKP